MTHADARAVKGMAWPRDLICLRLTTLNPSSIAETVYDLSCRTNFDAPGFCVVHPDAVADAVSLRRLMVDLKSAMDAIHASRTGGRLSYLSASSFDQKLTTKPHLDGGPDECLLMLGYEPTNVRSRIEILDYARCAFGLGLTPKTFMARHNPLFGDGCRLLEPYRIQIPCFPSADYKILCVNNSSAPYSADHSTWQGVLHAAVIEAANEADERILNSTMIAAVPPDGDHGLSRAEQLAFIHGSAGVVGEWP
jgi:hypothetical protein